MATKTPAPRDDNAAETQETAPLQTPAQAPIPNPPGGGKWRWDADAAKWLPND